MKATHEIQREDQAAPQKDIYTHYKLCPKLMPKERCFRARKYNQGKYQELFHEHVPQHRMALGDAISFMKALVLRYNRYRAAYMMLHYLNSRGQTPSAIKVSVAHEYPEPGVNRWNCSCSDMHAWMDQIISPQYFRKVARSARAEKSKVKRDD